MDKIDGINFFELDAERYWSFPKSYKNDKKTETRNMIMGGEYMGSRKIDGAYYRFIKDMNGEMRLQGRNKSVKGEYINKIGHVPHLQPFFQNLPNGTCLLGELYFPDDEGSNRVTTITGCLEEKAIARQKEKKLNYYIFDIWAFDGESFLTKSAEHRFQFLEEIKTKYESQYVQWAHYCDRNELWELLQTTLQIGGEGVVITKKQSVPAPGKRTARKTLKIKKEISDTIDVIIMGANPPTIQYGGKDIDNWEYWQDSRTNQFIKGKKYKDYFAGTPLIPVTKAFFNNWAGSLKIGVYKNEKIVQIGNLSGLDEEILQNWREYIGKVAEISCMEIYKDTENMGLRHPRFEKWRSLEDKNPKDCTWESIYENENL